MCTLVASVMAEIGTHSISTCQKAPMYQTDNPCPSRCEKWYVQSHAENEHYSSKSWGFSRIVRKCQHYSLLVMPTKVLSPWGVTSNTQAVP